MTALTPELTVRTDAVIVGSGPAGAAMALALSTYGVDHVVVTRYPTLAAEPRAHITNQRTMEVLRDLGVADQVIAQATPQDLMGTTTFCTSLAGEELGRILGSSAWTVNHMVARRRRRAPPPAVERAGLQHLDPGLVQPRLEARPRPARGRRPGSSRHLQHRAGPGRAPGRRPREPLDRRHRAHLRRSRGQRHREHRADAGQHGRSRRRHPRGREAAPRPAGGRPAPCSSASAKLASTASTESFSRASRAVSSTCTRSCATSGRRTGHRLPHRRRAEYPIPTDGPVGDLLAATARHPYRPAHVHFLVEAPGHVPLTTHAFVADSPYIDSDAVFAVKQSLVREFTLDDDADSAARHGLPTPFHRARFDIVLQPL